MTLAARFEEASKPKTLPCRLGQILAILDVEDRVALTVVLEDRAGYGATLIASVLRLEGHAVGATTVKAHRSEVRSCVVA